MRSRHITGHAVDLVPYVKGMGLRWDWPLCIRVAEAMKLAAKTLDVPVVWGGVWDMRINDIQGDLEDAMADYAQRMRMIGKKPFLDGPHFELEKTEYPV
jgi:peptidoglycan L-alanyl-D-glutamate endopeptidase CwlK